MNCPNSKQPCEGKKVLHITELKDGSYTTFHMCEKCAANYKGEPIEPEIKSESSILNLISLLLAGVVSKKQMSEQSNTKCPGCGTTPKDIAQTGRFGCVKCYDYYQSSVEHILKKCQNGATKHVGKVPKRVVEEEITISIQDKIKSLENKMARAIKIENYEVAGVLKTKIKELQQQLPKD